MDISKPKAVATKSSPELVAADLRVSIGGHSMTGLKTRNDDAFAARLPDTRSARQMKGVVAAIADGISVSERSHMASQLSVTQFIEDYLSTPDSWGVETCASKVLRALNDWLFAQTKSTSSLGGTSQSNAMVTTFSAAVIRSKTLHIFHIGDSRIYRLRDGELNCLTRDHAVNFTRDDTVLTAALGMDSRLMVDYSQTDLEEGDIVFLATDGITSALSHDKLQRFLSDKISNSASLDDTSKALCQAALDAGSQDNLTCGLLKIETLSQENMDEAITRLQALKIPPVMTPGNKIDGLEIISVLHSGTRSHVYIARDIGADARYVLKAPSRNFEEDATYLEGFVREQWVGRRLSHPGLMKVHPPRPDSPFLYLLCEEVRGQTLRDWMTEHQRPSLSEVRDILAEIIPAIRAMHRMGMVHRDLKPENIMLNYDGTVKIIDYGTVKVAGLDDIGLSALNSADDLPVGAVNYTAPEAVLGQNSDVKSDLFSLGVITYEMLAGHRPYPEIKNRNHSLDSWRYTSLGDSTPDLPFWASHAVARACAANPSNRTDVLSEFLEDLRRPSQRARQAEDNAALLERNPVAFWKGATLICVTIIIILCALLAQTTV